MNTTIILVSVGVFLLLTLLLVIVLLVAKSKLVPSGNVKLTINGEKEAEVPIGGTLLNTLQSENIYLSSACGGSGSCGQCRCRVIEGGGEILPTETGFFSRKEQKEHWRLACQTKVKEDMQIIVPEEVFGVKEWECEVISNRNVSTFIKEFVVKLPEGEVMNFQSGSYAQITIPPYDIKYADYDIDEKFRSDWDHFDMWSLTCKNDTETIRAYSMANYPAEGNIITLNVRIATPPMDRATHKWLPVSPGISSSYIFSLKPGDKGKQGRVIKVFPAEQKVLVEGVNLKTRHVRQGQTQGSAGGIETVEAPISLSKVALVDPDTKKRVRVGFREDTVERDGRTRTVRVRVTRGGAKRGIEQGKEI